MGNPDLHKFTELLIQFTQKDYNYFTQPPLVNARVMAEEIILLKKYVKDKILDIKALKRAEEEFKEKFNKDPIIKKILEGRQYKSGDVFDYLNEVIGVLNTKYLEELLTSIKESILSSNDNIDELVGLLVADLRSRGFSLEVIGKYAKWMIVQEGTTESIIENFIKQTKTPYEFKVVFKGGADLLSMKDSGISEDVVEIKKQPTHGTEDIETMFYGKKNKTYITVKKVPAFDKISAKRSAFDTLRLMFAMNKVSNPNLDVEMDTQSLVYHDGLVNLVDTYEHCLSNSCFDIKHKDLERTYVRLNECSKNMFISSVIAYNSALRSRELEVQFVFIWAAIESLLIYEGNVIQAVSSKMIPIICKTIEPYDKMNIEERRKEIEFSLNRLYWMRNIIIHKSRTHSMICSAISTLDFYYCQIISGICGKCMESDKPDSRSLKSIIRSFNREVKIKDVKT